MIVVDKVKAGTLSSTSEAVVVGGIQHRTSTVL